MIRTDNSSFVWYHRVLDVVAPNIILLLVVAINDISLNNTLISIGVGARLLFSSCVQLFGIYTSWRGRSVSQSISQLAICWIITWIAVVVILYFYQTFNISRLLLIQWFSVTLFTVIAYRLAIRFILAVVRNKTQIGKKIAIFGAGDLGHTLAETINSNRWMGFEVIAFYDDNVDLHGKIEAVPILGGCGDMLSDLNKKCFDEIYICLPMRAEDRIKELLNIYTDTTAVVKVVPDLFAFDLLHSKITNIRGIPVVSVFDTPFNSLSAKFLKRVEDIVLSMFILTLISPLMLLLAIGVKMSSKGPVFYKQTRVGWNGQNFSMLKFRSMPVDTESTGVTWGNATSKTNTKFGKFIRATSLDELPQFINVLKGEMSIVGPRPERDVFVEQFRKEIPRYMQKHMAKAGITGWAQINGWRGDTSLEKRVEFDLFYINHWTLWFDIKIIVLTLFKGFVNKNAR